MAHAGGYIIWGCSTLLTRDIVEDDGKRYYVDDKLLRGTVDAEYIFLAKYTMGLSDAD